MSTDNQTVPARNIWNKLWAKKYLFLKVWVITFILSVAYIVPQPRTYSSSILLAPEMSNGDEMGGLSAIASSFGFNLGVYRTAFAKVETKGRCNCRQTSHFVTV